MVKNDNFSKLKEIKKRKEKNCRSTTSLYLRAEFSSREDCWIKPGGCDWCTNQTSLKIRAILNLVRVFLKWNISQGDHFNPTDLHDTWVRVHGVRLLQRSVLRSGSLQCKFARQCHKLYYCRWNWIIPLSCTWKMSIWNQGRNRSQSTWIIFLSSLSSHIIKVRHWPRSDPLNAHGIKYHPDQNNLPLD